MVDIITGRVPRCTQNLHRTRTMARAPTSNGTSQVPLLNRQQASGDHQRSNPHPRGPTAGGPQGEK